MNISARITEEMAAMPNLDGSKVRLGQVEAAIRLIDEGNTIPFIARYRKEATGSLNDEQLRFLGERLTALRNLEDKKQQVLSAIEEQGKLTEELRQKIEAGCRGGSVPSLQAEAENACRDCQRKGTGALCGLDFVREGRQRIIDRSSQIRDKA